MYTVNILKQYYSSGDIQKVVYIILRINNRYNDDAMCDDDSMKVFKIYGQTQDHSDRNSIDNWKQ